MSFSSQLISEVASRVEVALTTGVTAFVGFLLYLLTSNGFLSKLNLLLKSNGLYVLGLNVEVGLAGLFAVVGLLHLAR